MNRWGRSLRRGRWKNGGAILRGRRGLGAIALLLWFMVMVLPMAPAQATVHTYRERPGQVTLRSKQSLRDRADRAWQAVVFKRWSADQTQGLYLRLVGFPGAVQVDRHRPLTILAPTGQQWQASPQLDTQTPALPDNAVQYAIAPLLLDLDAALPLEMQVPLMGQAGAELGVAPFVVKEWLAVARSAPPESSEGLASTAAD